jgi:hypothetical protein
MINQHPITPPPELVEERWTNSQSGVDFVQEFATFFAQWGADQELEACINWLDDTDCEDPQEVAQRLRAARRFKPPSLKEQALDELTSAERLYPADWSTIRRALETLPND